MERWIKCLADDEWKFIREIIEANFKINQYQENTGYSYFITRQKMHSVRLKIIKANKKSEFKEYLDFLVYENALMSAIAENLYKMHLKELGG